MLIEQRKTDAPEPIRDKRHVMRFGKYKGFSVEHIAERDRRYLIWLHYEPKIDFEFHADLIDELENTDWTQQT